MQLLYDVRKQVSTTKSTRYVYMLFYENIEEYFTYYFKHEQHAVFYQHKKTRGDSEAF